MALPPLLPKIAQPSLTGGQDPRLDLTIVSRESRQRPKSCPETLTPQTNDLLQALTQKVSGSRGYALRQAFKASDMRGEGSISREALYHIVCNLLLGINRKQFNHLLNQMGLNSVKTISYEHFISCLPGSTTRVRSRPRTSFLPLRGEEGHGEVALQVMERCRQMDTYQTGKLTVEQLRRVLRVFGVPATPMQLAEVCQQLGYREGQLVNYADVLGHFTTRAKSGILHNKLTNKQQRFHQNVPGRVCTSSGDAETRLVTLFNSQFLKILAAFKSHDPKGRGYVPKDVFVSILGAHKGNSSDIEEVAATLCEDGSDWIPYPKFLAMFETVPMANNTPPQSVLYQDPGKLALKIQSLVTSHCSEVVDVFESIDTANTGRLTTTTARELLERFGVKCSLSELEAVWQCLLRNKDNTVQFHEFLRQFSTKPATGDGRHLTEDHCFMLSKTLHRDEDILINSAIAMLRRHQPAVLQLLSKHDPLKTGYLPVTTFLESISGAFPQLSADQLQALRQRLGDTVPYTRIFSKPRYNPYRHGDNMSGVMVHKPVSYFASANPPAVLTARPPYGLSGVKVHLQKQLAKHWRESRRLFRELDKDRTGQVGVAELWRVLQQCGVELSSDDQFYILELLDPQLQGSIDYHHFITTIFEL